MLQRTKDGMGLSFKNKIMEKTILEGQFEWQIFIKTDSIEIKNLCEKGFDCDIWENKKFKYVLSFFNKDYSKLLKSLRGNWFKIWKNKSEDKYYNFKFEIKK